MAFLNASCSWRHTPFRKTHMDEIKQQQSSWRHTPFRNPQ
ncbi:hypothetical protein J558_0342 [Acinetobacter baumannii 1106579]|nr:hypothetical protein J558_0342 [Acinetobacter baumannii 1106579]